MPRVRKRADDAATGMRRRGNSRRRRRKRKRRKKRRRRRRRPGPQLQEKDSEKHHPGNKMWGKGRGKDDSDQARSSTGKQTFKTLRLKPSTLHLSTRSATLGSVHGLWR
jgi:hypothetical protein